MNIIVCIKQVLDPEAPVSTFGIDREKKRVTQRGAAILAEASLSFLGVGIEPPAAAWSLMVEDGRKYLLDYPLLSFAPGLAIILVVFAFNMVGDGLRDALDPRLRGTV